MARQRRDRSKAIQDDIDNKSNYGGNRKGFTKSDDELKELGVLRYVSDTHDGGKKKDHFLHVLPPHDDDGVAISLKLFVHWGVGPDKSAYLCPQMMRKVFVDYGIPVPAEIKDGRCPICDEWSKKNNALKAKKEANPSDDFEAYEKEVKALNPFPPRYLVWVMDARDEEGEDKGLQIIVLPKKVYDGLLGLCRNKRTGAILDITDPEEGKTFIFSREGKGLMTTYGDFSSEDRDPLPDEWIDAVLYYTNVLSFATYDEIATDFLGTTPKEEDAVGEGEKVAVEIAEAFEEESEERSTRRRPRRNSRKEEPSEEEPERDVDDDRRDKIRENVEKRRNRVARNDDD